MYNTIIIIVLRDFKLFLYIFYTYILKLKVGFVDVGINAIFINMVNINWNKFILFNGHGFGQISWAINITATHYRNMIR